MFENIPLNYQLHPNPLSINSTFLLFWKNKVLETKSYTVVK